jgi:MFS family permease
MTSLASLEKKTAAAKSRGAILHQVIFSGIGLSSDGYNAQVISSASLVLSRLYPNQLTSDLKTRLSQAYFIGEIIGECVMHDLSTFEIPTRLQMLPSSLCPGALSFGCLIDRISRRAGVVSATLLLLLGVILSTAASGASVQGMIWMLIIGRGVLGVGAGGEYPGMYSSSPCRQERASTETIPPPFTLSSMLHWRYGSIQ